MEHKDSYICYNRADFDWVQSLAEQIESETIDGLPASRNLTVFFDKWDIGPGQSLIDRMNQGMESSRHAVVILSPEFLNADWPRFEWKNIVAQNPSNVGEKIIPIMLRDVTKEGKDRIELCAPFRDLRYIDFRKQSDFKRSFIELIRKIRNLPPERGRKLVPITGKDPILPTVQLPDTSWLADKVPDLLLSNLFAVRALPQQIWKGQTNFRKPKEVWDRVPNDEPFILRDGCLYTFAPLNSPRTNLRMAITSGSEKTESCYDWLLRTDRKTWLMALFNTCLRKHLRRKEVLQDDKGRYYFAPNKNGTDRIYHMSSGKPRTVAARKGDADNPFWVHYGAKIRFRCLGESLFLSVEPIFLFTKDGNESITGKNAGRLSLQWGGKQFNPDILRNTLFWGTVLSNARNQIALDTGDKKKIILDSMPATSRMEYGVAFDRIKMRALLDQADNVLNEMVQAEEDVEQENEEGNGITPE